MAQNEGAKFWLGMVSEFCGVRDILIVVIDGLKGFPEGLRSVFPETQAHTCIVHQMRHGLNPCSWKERPRMANDIKAKYWAGSVERAADRLDEFGRHWAAATPRWSAASGRTGRRSSHARV